MSISTIPNCKPLSKDLWAIISSYSSSKDKQALAAVCRDARDGVQLDDESLINRIPITIANIAKDALKQFADPRESKVHYRKCLNGLTLFLCNYNPPLRSYSSKISLRLELDSYFKRLPRHDYSGIIADKKGNEHVAIPIQRSAFYEFVNGILPPEKQFGKKGLDLSPTENEEEAALIAWHQNLNSPTGREKDPHYTQILQAVLSGKIDCESRIDKEPLLCIAARHGLIDLVKALVDAGAYIEDSAPPISPTPLAEAIMKFITSSDDLKILLSETISFLREQGASLDALINKTQSILEYTIERFKNTHETFFLNIIKSYLSTKKADINFPISKKIGFLVEKIKDTDWDFIDLLIKHYHHEIITNRNNDTLLHWLVHQATNTHPQDTDYGIRAIFLMAYSNQNHQANGNVLEIREKAYLRLETLIKSGVRIDVKNNNKMTPLQMLFETSKKNSLHVDQNFFLKVLRLFLKENSIETIKKQDLNATVFLGDSLLSYTMKKNTELFDLLIAARVNLDMPNSNGRTALYTALENATSLYFKDQNLIGIEQLTKLLKAGANPNIGNPYAYKADKSDRSLLIGYNWANVDVQIKNKVIKLFIELCGERLDHLDTIKNMIE